MSQPNILACPNCYSTNFNVGVYCILNIRLFADGTKVINFVEKYDSPEDLKESSNHVDCLSCGYIVKIGNLMEVPKNESK